MYRVLKFGERHGAAVQGYANRKRRQAARGKLPVKVGLHPLGRVNQTKCRPRGAQAMVN